MGMQEAGNLGNSAELRTQMKEMLVPAEGMQRSNGRAALSCISDGALCPVCTRLFTPLSVSFLQPESENELPAAAVR